MFRKFEKITIWWIALFTLRTTVQVRNDNVQWRSQPDSLVMLCKYFRVYRLSISKEMNNNNDFAT